MSHRSVQCGGENCPLMDLSKANLNFPHLTFIDIFNDFNIYHFNSWIYSNILNMYSNIFNIFKHILSKVNLNFPHLNIVTLYIHIFRIYSIFGYMQIF